MKSSDQYQPSEELLAEVRSRVSRVCQHYDASELEELVWEIAYVRSKYEYLKTEGFFLAARDLTFDSNARQRLSRIPPRAD